MSASVQPVVGGDLVQPALPASSEPITEVPFAEFSARVPLKIRTKEGDVVVFRPNVVQQIIDRKIDELIERGKPIRLIVLKARQEGVSTYSLGKGYQYVTTQEGRHALLVAHDDDSTTQLFDRLRLMYDLAEFRPMVRYSSKTELDFSNPNRARARAEPGLLSKFQVGTAGKLNLGRSFTLQYLHLSEVAFWRNASNVLLGLEQALPKNPGTIEIIESTANGVGGEFYERWERASDPKSAGDWVPLFFPWWIFPEYQIDPCGEMLPIPSCADDHEAWKLEENEIRGLYDLTDAQLNWRRWCIVNQCGNDLEKFHQEYPSSPEEAFVASGRPVFNQNRIMFRIRKLKAIDLRRRAGGERPRFVTGNIRSKMNHLHWLPRPDGSMRVYKWPKKGHRYVVGADVSEGMTIGKDPDYCAAQVFDRLSWEQVAVFQAHCTPSEFAEFLRLIGYFYNTAKLAPEANNHGHTVCVKLEEMQYPNLYLRQDFDRLGNKVQERVGWITNVKTRGILVDAASEGIDDNLAVMNDLPTLFEMLRFVRDEKTGKAQGSEGCHDDLVISYGITLAVISYGDHVIARRSKLNLEHINPEQQMVARMLGRQQRAIREERRIRYGATR